MSIMNCQHCFLLLISVLFIHILHSAVYKGKVSCLSFAVNMFSLQPPDLPQCPSPLAECLNVTIRKM